MGMSYSGREGDDDPDQEQARLKQPAQVQPMNMQTPLYGRGQGGQPPVARTFQQPPGPTGTPGQQTPMPWTAALGGMNGAQGAQATPWAQAMMPTQASAAAPAQGAAPPPQQGGGQAPNWGMLQRMGAQTGGPQQRGLMGGGVPGAQMGGGTEQHGGAQWLQQLMQQLAQRFAGMQQGGGMGGGMGGGWRR